MYKVSYNIQDKCSAAHFHHRNKKNANISNEKHL